MDLLPEELLLAALLRRAIKDAQGKQDRIRDEAAGWLWMVAPSIAKRADVPRIDRFMNKDTGMGNITAI